MKYSASQASIGWLRDTYLSENLDIRPPYQRNPVWAARQKCSLIETILLQLPVPEIFVQQSSSPEGHTQYAVVDGQQRVRTILQFIGADLDPEEQEWNKFPLDKIDVESHWHGITFSDLTDVQRKTFFDYLFAVRFLQTENEVEVRDTFKRLNKFLTPLNAQELRNAVYRGPLISLATRLADDEYWAVNKIVSPSSIRRMADIELVSELLIGVLHGPQGGSSAAIDEYYERFEDYEEEFPGQRDAEKYYQRTLQTVGELLPNIAETRWGNKTDFYTLFIATATLLKTHRLPRKNVRPLRQRLELFATQVAKRLSDEEANVPQRAIEYVRAVEKGANDKMRRTKRHEVMFSLLAEYFTPLPTSK